MLSQSAVVFDESRWPLLIVDFVAIDKDEFQGARGTQHAHEMNEAMLGYLGKRQRFGMVLDFTRSNSVSSTFRNILADFERDHSEVFSNLGLRCIGTRGRENAHRVR